MQAFNREIIQPGWSFLRAAFSGRGGGQLSGADLVFGVGAWESA